MNSKLLMCLIAICFLGLFACDSNTDSLEDIINETSHSISFANPVVGQTSFYRGVYRNLHENGQESTYAPVNDTLVVWIAEDLGSNKYLFLETFTEGSENDEIAHRDTIGYVVDLSDPDVLQLRQIEDDPFISSYSYLFDSADRSFSLLRLTENEATINGYDISLPFDNEIGYLPGYTENYELLGNTYEHLNVFINEEDMAFDGNGITLLYSAKNGIVQAFVYNGFSGIGIGWELL